MINGEEHHFSQCDLSQQRMWENDLIQVAFRKFLKGVVDRVNMAFSILPVTSFLSIESGYW
jgi:hypothetical protein